MNADDLFYKFDFTEVKATDFIPLVAELFLTKDWQELLAKRNHIAKTIVDQRGNNHAVMKTLDVIETKLGKVLLYSFFNAAKIVKAQKSTTALDIMNRPETTPEQCEQIENVIRRVDALTFLNDIMLGYLTDTESAIKKVNPLYTIPELELVKHSLQTMYEWGRQRRENDSEAESELFNEYSDSIANKLQGRINTYVKRRAEIHKKEHPNEESK